MSVIFEALHTSLDLKIWIIKLILRELPYTADEGIFYWVLAYKISKHYKVFPPNNKIKYLKTNS